MARAGGCCLASKRIMAVYCRQVRNVIGRRHGFIYEAASQVWQVVVPSFSRCSAKDPQAGQLGMVPAFVVSTPALGGF